MENFNRKKHWESIYETKPLESVSWYQPTPEASLHFFKEFNIPFSAKIIDIGGGDSFLPDFLLKAGYQNITVLDISQNAIDRAKNRLGKNAENITWIVTDISEFQTDEKYDVWHDRAAFHFLTQEKEISNYIEITQKNIAKDGFLIIGTFSETGPKKCSGIPICQYSEESLVSRFNKGFQKIKCFSEDHQTPFNTFQSFIFCCFQRI